MNSVTLPRTIANRLLSQAQQDNEVEVCGLLGAIDDIPVSVYPIDNIADEKQRWFEMDPEKQIAAIKHMRLHGEQLFAIYHSHPHSAAIPSATDIQQANYPEAIYLIISLNTKGVLEIRGYKIEKGRCKEIELSV